MRKRVWNFIWGNQGNFTNSHAHELSVNCELCKNLPSGLNTTSAISTLFIKPSTQNGPKSQSPMICRRKIFGDWHFVSYQYSNIAEYSFCEIKTNGKNSNQSYIINSILHLNVLIEALKPCERQTISLWNSMNKYEEYLEMKTVSYILRQSLRRHGRQSPWVPFLWFSRYSTDLTAQKAFYKMKPTDIRSKHEMICFTYIAWRIICMWLNITIGNVFLLIHSHIIKGSSWWTTYVGSSTLQRKIILVYATWIRTNKGWVQCSHYFKYIGIIPWLFY